MKKLSPTMKLAIELAKENGGRLKRRVSRKNWMGLHIHPDVDPRTIQALVARGLAVCSECDGHWLATEITLTEEA